MVNLPLREELRGAEPYGAPQDPVPVRLNVNENPYPVPDQVVQTMVKALEEIAPGLNRYADRDASELRADLAAYLKKESSVTLEPDQIWAANGSNEVMLHLFQAYGGAGRVALSAIPTYSMYHEYARDTGTAWATVERTDDFTLDLGKLEQALHQHRPSLLLLASPNNPTGTALPLTQVRQILRMCATTGPQIDGADTATVVVIDEAYAEFRRPNVPSALTLLADHPHLVVSRTMSKAFSLAGLRLGYCAGDPTIIRHLQTVRLPYHLSAVTQACARAALAHSDQLLAAVDQLRQRRDDLVQWLREEGFTVAESDANFVLFGPFANREDVFQQLLAKGILIRVVGPEGWLRASVGTESEDARLRAALKEITR
ncbi:MAG: histidinol-phosphate transaminase [Actinomycetaceae bacterium]|nr:histidinol-phosphate transaminase [Actinomycetaceae bacterium]